MKKLFFGMLVLTGLLLGSCTADDLPSAQDVKLEGGPSGGSGGIPPPPPPPPGGGG